MSLTNASIRRAGLAQHLVWLCSRAHTIYQLDRLLLGVSGEAHRHGCVFLTADHIERGTYASFAGKLNEIKRRLGADVFPLIDQVRYRTLTSVQIADLIDCLG